MQKHWKFNKVTHSFKLTHSNSLTHTHYRPLAYSPIHSPIHLPIHSPIHSTTHSLAYPLAHPLTRSLTQNHSINQLINQLINQSFTIPSIFCIYVWFDVDPNISLWIVVIFEYLKLFYSHPIKVCVFVYMSRILLKFCKWVLSCHIGVFILFYGDVANFISIL